MKRKQLLIAILFCLIVTTTLFTVLPTHSATNPYDPWLDTNEDGRINMRDINAAILSFNTYGDTTKNINVTNWPYLLTQNLNNFTWSIHEIEQSSQTDRFLAVNYSWTDWGQYKSWTAQYNSTLEGSARGFSRISVQITATMTSLQPYWVNVSIPTIFWQIVKPSVPYGISGASPIPDPARLQVYMNNSNPFSGLTVSGVAEVRAPYYMLNLEIQPECQTGWVLVDIYTYLRND